MPEIVCFGDFWQESALLLPLLLALHVYWARTLDTLNFPFEPETELIDKR